MIGPVVKTAVPAGPKIFAIEDISLTMRCGGRTIPETIDHLSVTSPQSVWARCATSSESFERGELLTVTFSTLARAIDTLAWHLHDQITPSSGSGIVLYIGPSDIRYFILVCAACKCNLKVSIMNPRTFEENKS